MEQFVIFFYLAPKTNIVPGYLTGSLYFGTKDRNNFIKSYKILVPGFKIQIY
jgi:hypothetical protein